MALLSNTAVLLGKELRTEFRSRELLTTTIVFILIVIVLFSLPLTPRQTNRGGSALGFSAGVSVRRFAYAAACFLREQTNDTLSALRLS